MPPSKPNIFNEHIIALTCQLDNMRGNAYPSRQVARFVPSS